MGCIYLCVVRQVPVVTGGRLTRSPEKGYFSLTWPRVSAQKFPGRGQRKKDRKIALFSLYQEGRGTMEKRPKNSTKKTEKEHY